MGRKFIDTFLESPIIRNDRDKLLFELLSHRAEGQIPLGTKGRRKLKEYIEFMGNQELQALEPLEYFALDHLLKPESFPEDLISSAQACNSVVTAVTEGLKEWGVKSPNLTKIPTDVGKYLRIQEYYDKMRFFETFANTVARSRASGRHFLQKVKIKGGEFFGDEYNAILKIDGIKTLYLLSFSQILMFKDMYYGRFNTLLCAYLLDPSCGLGQTVLSCLDWFLSCLSRYGNVGYEIAKSLEDLTKTNIIRKSDPILGEDGSHQDMLLVVKEKEKARGATDAFMVDLLEDILRKERPIEHDVELFGLQKLSGHPLVDPLKGGEKVLKIIREVPQYSPSEVQRVRNNFCRMYTEGYVRKERRWPPLIFSSDRKETRLYQLYTLNELKVRVNSYPLEDWTGVTFAKHHDFDFYPNFTDLMDDKSISYYRPDLGATWDSSIRPRSHKKLLMEMLSRPEISVEKIVHQVRNGDIPFSWKIVSLYPKEREFKLDPRMFGMMVFEMRAFFTATEANLAEQVFPYMPPQTMTLSKVEIQEIFHRVTDPVTGEGTKRLFGEFDMSSWNLHFRPQIVDPIGRDVEDMFGLPGVFTVIHHFFKECIMVVRVHGCEPKNWKEAQVEGAFLDEMCESVMWNKHEPGIEGLSQKHWALVTYAFIDLGLNKFGNSYYLIGQADNQVYAMLATGLEGKDMRTELRALDQACRKAVSEECGKAGHILNLDECIGSTSVITYSKDIYINGAEYYTTLKAHSRIFPHAATDFPSIGNSVDSITGQCLAAAERNKDPMKSYALCLFHTALYLFTFTRTRPLETTLASSMSLEPLTFNTVRALLIYPGELGGLSIGHFFGFLYKGGADPLSKAYASLALLKNSSVVARRIMCVLKDGLWNDKLVDKKALLDDPYSLPLKKPMTPAMAILKRSMNKVQGITENRELKELMSLEVGEYEEGLDDLLLKVTPFNPVLLSDLKSLSVAGVRRTVSKMFTSTQTVQALLQGDDDMNPCTRILTTGWNHFLSLLSRLQNMPETEWRPTSVFSAVTELRRAWDPKEKTELPGVTTAVPLDLPVEVTEYPTDTPGIKIYLADNIGIQSRYVRGTEEPYIGRPTREKRSVHGYKIVASSAPERAIKKLSDIATQPGVGPDLTALIDQIASTRGNVDLIKTLPLLGKVYGGTIVHRYSSKFGHRGANILGCNTLASRCLLSTDNAPPLSGGLNDYSIMIQEPMVASEGLVNLCL
ncbi:MAG: RNA-dependent RNA polymerase, partial [Grapevine-associated mononega-like virus 3]